MDTIEAVLVVETKGSVWQFNEATMTYVRMPKTEGPRWSPPGKDWGGPNAQPGLRDLVRHSYVSVELPEECVFHDEPCDDCPHLVIHVDDERVIRAPNAYVLFPL